MFLSRGRAPEVTRERPRDSKAADVIHVKLNGCDGGLRADQGRALRERPMHASSSSALVLRLIPKGNATGARVPYGALAGTGWSLSPHAEESALEGQKALRRGQRARAEAVPTSIS